MAKQIDLKSRQALIRQRIIKAKQNGLLSGPQDKTQAWETKVAAPEFMPFTWCFKGDMADFVKSVLPFLWVHARKAQNVPTAADPLGTKSPIVLAYDSNYHTLQLQVFDESSPWLLPEALEGYALIQWPDLFRRSTDGTAPT